MKIVLLIIAWNKDSFPISGYREETEAPYLEVAAKTAETLSGLTKDENYPTATYEVAEPTGPCRQKMLAYGLFRDGKKITERIEK